MPPSNPAVIVLADAHLGATEPAVEADLLAFLERVPQLGSHLVINGDLFDFWFEYRTVVSREAFPTLSALRRVRDAGVALTLTGGNHDRWGGTFFSEYLDAAFHPDGTELKLAGWRTWLTHGDGLSEQHWGGGLMHRVTRFPLTARLFRAIHPDFGFRLAQWMSHGLAEQTRDGAALDRAAAAQAAFARSVLARRADLDLVVFAHTHRPSLQAVAERRWYLNPGSWLDGRHYAVITDAGPSLQSFSR